MPEALARPSMQHTLLVRCAVLLLLLQLRHATAKSWNLCESCRWMGDCRCFPDCFSAEQCASMPNGSAHNGVGRRGTGPLNCTREHGYVQRYTVLKIRRRWRQYHLSDTQPAELTRLIAEAEAANDEPAVDCAAQRSPHPQCFTRIVHQSWKTATPPDQMREWSESWQRLNPGYEYRLWTDEDNRAFIAEHYPWCVGHGIPWFNCRPCVPERLRPRLAGFSPPTTSTGQSIGAPLGICRPVCPAPEDSARWLSCAAA